MDKIQELKKEAYRIETETYGDGGGLPYRYSVDVRLDAMRTYAQLIVAEKTNNPKLMDTNANL